MHLSKSAVASIALLIVLGASEAFAQALITAAPPALNRSSLVEKSTPPSLLLGSDVQAHRIALSTPSAAELVALKARNTAPLSPKLQRAKARALAIAFGRAIPASAASVSLTTLPWQRLQDGSRAARIEVASPGAAALRVALRMPVSDPDLEVRFSGSAPGAQTFGPVPANRIASDALDYGKYWSPVIAGETAIIELHAGVGAVIDGEQLQIATVSHQVVGPADLKSAVKLVGDIGQAGSCNIDIKCRPQTAGLVNESKAVAEIEITQDDGETVLCTGQLLNDTAQTLTPWFFTANHCMNSAGAARSLNTFWFFDAVACNSGAVPQYVQQANGSTLLARSEDFDWALVRLNAPPPGGTYFSAWRAEPVTQGASVEVIHHAMGDLKKWAGGSAQGYHGYQDGSSFVVAQYTLGTTEGGSSGAGLLTLDPTGSYYEVRGGLFGGAASCSNPSGTDEYSRLDNMLPLTRDYLTPGNGNGYVAVVEFYNAGLDHYFMSTNPSEINDLDTGVHPGWVRTGFRFLASAAPGAGLNPVCRFYRSPAFGDSHFYSASPKECSDTAAAHPVDWTYESSQVFYIQLPDQVTGACPANTRPVWRFFNQRTTNHRYTADVTIQSEMAFDPFTWVAEGYGPNSVIMCSPVGS